MVVRSSHCGATALTAPQSYPPHCGAIPNGIRVWSAALLRRRLFLLRARAAATPTPKIRSARAAVPVAQILWDVIEPYPSQSPTLVWRLLDC